MRTPTPTPTPESASIQSDGATGQSSQVAIDLSTTSLTVKEGGTASYTVKLNHEPYATVIVAISLSSVGIITANKYSLTFTSSILGQLRPICLWASRVSCISFGIRGHRANRNGVHGDANR